MASTTISQVRDALKTVLAGLTGVHAYDIWPNDPATIETPAIMIKPSGARLDAFDGQCTYQFEISVLCQSRIPQTAQDQLDALLSFSGATTASIFRRIWANPGLSGEVEHTDASTWRDYGGILVGTQEFIGALIDVEVMVTVG